MVAIIQGFDKMWQNKNEFFGYFGINDLESIAGLIPVSLMIKLRGVVLYSYVNLDLTYKLLKKVFSALSLTQQNISRQKVVIYRSFSPACALTHRRTRIVSGMDIILTIKDPYFMPGDWILARGKNVRTSIILPISIKCQKLM